MLLCMHCCWIENECDNIMQWNRGDERNGPIEYHIFLWQNYIRVQTLYYTIILLLSVKTFRENRNTRCKRIHLWHRINHSHSRTKYYGYLIGYLECTISPLFYWRHRYYCMTDVCSFCVSKRISTSIDYNMHAAQN